MMIRFARTRSDPKRIAAMSLPHARASRSSITSLEQSCCRQTRQVDRMWGRISEPPLCALDGHTAPDSFPGPRAVVVRVKPYVDTLGARGKLPRKRSSTLYVSAGSFFIRRRVISKRVSDIGPCSCRLCGRLLRACRLRPPCRLCLRLQDQDR